MSSAATHPLLPAWLLCVSSPARATCDRGACAPFPPASPPCRCCRRPAAIDIRDTRVRNFRVPHEAAERLIQTLRLAAGVLAQGRYGERHHGQLINVALAKTLGLHHLREHAE